MSGKQSPKDRVTKGAKACNCLRLTGDKYREAKYADKSVPKKEQERGSTVLWNSKICAYVLKMRCLVQYFQAWSDEKDNINNRSH